MAKAKVLYSSTEDANMRYKVRTLISDPFYYIGLDGEEFIVLDKREYDAYLDLETRNKDIQVLPYETFAPESKADLLQKVLKKLGVDEVEFPTNFPLDVFQEMQEIGFKSTVTKDVFPDRTIKSEEEIGYIMDVISVIEEGFALVVDVLKSATVAGDYVKLDGGFLTTEWLKGEVESLFFSKGLHMPHGLILSSGRHSAMPHHMGEGRILSNSFIICDFFPQSRKTGYFGDLTRTFCKGHPTEKMEKIYAAVLEAHDRSMELIAPGVGCNEVHEKACETIKNHGFDVGTEGFNHALGHSFGLEIHEMPVCATRCKVALEAGMLMTVEPGLYYSDLGGVRIEDDVVVTENGYECLSTFSTKDWIIR